VHGWIGGAGAASWTLTLARGDLDRLDTLDLDGQCDRRLLLCKLLRDVPVMAELRLFDR
jgi:hypothetical protein